MIENETGEVVGDLTTQPDPRAGAFGDGITIRREHRRMAMPGKSSRWSCALLREPRYQKATVTVFSFNDASARLHEKIGFRLEGRMRRTQFTDGACTTS